MSSTHPSPQEKAFLTQKRRKKHMFLSKNTASPAKGKGRERTATNLSLKYTTSVCFCRKQSGFKKITLRSKALTSVYAAVLYRKGSSLLEVNFPPYFCLLEYVKVTSLLLQSFHHLIFSAAMFSALTASF